jgi:hypothetical protein
MRLCTVEISLLTRLKRWTSQNQLVHGAGALCFLHVGCHVFLHDICQHGNQ